MSDTTPDPLEPNGDVLAAAAVVDGAATEAERARVAASAEAAGLLRQFTEDRDAVADVPVDPAGRAGAVAAAMAVFDSLHQSSPDAAAAAVAHTPGKVLAFERRKRQYRMVAGLAAAVVGIVGVGALLSQQSDSDQDASSATAAAAKVDEATAGGAAPRVAATESAADAATMDAATGDTTSGAAAAAAPAATEAPAGTEAPAMTESAAATAAPADTTAAPSPEPMAVIDTPQALSAWAATRPVGAGTLAASSCVGAGQEVLGDVVAAQRDAVVVRDPASGVITALDAATCATLLSTGP